MPVFMADVKGDLTGIAQAGTASEKLLTRLKNIGVNDWQPHADPVVVSDIFGEKGHPVRATVSDLGPLLLARLLNLNDVQSGVLNIIFRIADDGAVLLDLKICGRLPSTSAITPNLARISTVISVAHRLVPSGAGCCRWNSKAQHTSLVSRCWISKTGCAPMPTVKALSISSAPRNFIRCRNCTPPACCGCFQSCMNNCRKRAIWRNQNWCFSSTRHICCLTMPRRYCWIRLSR